MPEIHESYIIAHNAELHQITKEKYQHCIKSYCGQNMQFSDFGNIETEFSDDLTGEFKNRLSYQQKHWEQ